MKRAFLRADSSTSLGYGHISRCLALAGGLRARGYAPEFLCRDLPGHAGVLIRRSGCKLRLIPRGASRSAELAFVKRLLGGRKPLLVVDSNSIRSAYHKQLRPLTGTMLAIDDHGRGRFDCDVLVNHNAFASARMYHGKLPPGSTLLLGPRYALLRSQFAPRRRRGPAAGSARRVLIIMGGTDPRNIALKALRAVARTPGPRLATDLVLGFDNPHEDSLRAFARASGLRLRLHRGVGDMASLMSRADLAVTGAGVTALELAFMGIPALLVVLARDQADNARAMALRGTALNLGWHHRLSIDRVAERISTVASSTKRRADMSRRGLSLVDGRGVERVCAAISEWERK